MDRMGSGFIPRDQPLALVPALQPAAAVTPDPSREIGELLGPFQEFLPWGLLVVDRDRRIIFATPYARELLAAECGLKSAAETFQVERASVNRALTELVRRAAARTVGHEIGPVVIGAPDRQGRMRFALRLLPYQSPENSSLVLVAIMDLMRAGQMQRAKIAAIFGFSEREAELAELFSEGLRVQEIAVRMGVTVNTARVHLRNVFSKTGCANQIELARTFTMLPFFMGRVERIAGRVIGD
jgi:DNA-binding CsgD family transcriptional regulator